MTQTEEEYFISHPSAVLLLLVAMLVGNLVGFAAYANTTDNDHKRHKVEESSSKKEATTNEKETSAPKSDRGTTNPEDLKTHVGSGAHGSASGSSK